MSVQKDAKNKNSKSLNAGYAYNELRVSREKVEDVFYKNDCEKAGRAIIFNQIEFDEHDQRLGASKDSNNLNIIFESYGFDVKTYTDETNEVINEKLKLGKSKLLRINFSRILSLNILEIKRRSRK